MWLSDSDEELHVPDFTQPDPSKTTTARRDSFARAESELKTPSLPAVSSNEPAPAASPRPVTLPAHPVVNDADVSKLPLSIAHTATHAHAHVHSHTHTLHGWFCSLLHVLLPRTSSYVIPTLVHSLTLTHPLTVTPTPSHMHSHCTHSRCLLTPQICTHTHSHSRLTHARLLCFVTNNTPTLTLTRTHTHPHSPTLTHTLTLTETTRHLRLSNSQ